MRPFPTLVAVVLTAAVLAAALVDPAHWFSDNMIIAVAASVAAAFVAFSWWELWSTRHDR
jgi:hypothetical protein